MRISECQARTLAEAKELNLALPLNDGSKLNVTELSNSSENNSNNESNSNAGASYRGKINDYPNDLLEGEIASVNGNIVIGNGNEVIRCLRFGKSYPISNTYNKSYYIDDTNFIKNISYPSVNDNNNLQIDINTVPIVLYDVPVTINNYNNATSNNDLTIITYVKINNVDGVICDTNSKLGYMLYSDNFAEMFSDMFDDITELELFYFDKSTESVVVTNSNNDNAIKSFINTIYNRGNVITCIPPVRDFIVNSNENYDEFKISESFKFTKTNNNRGDVTIRYKNLIVTKDDISDKFYSKVNLLTEEIIDNTIINADFIKNKNNWDDNLSSDISQIELFKNYDDIQDYLETNNIEEESIYNIESLNSDYSPDEDNNKYLYILILISQDDNTLAILGLYYNIYYDTNIGYYKGFMFGNELGALCINDDDKISFTGYGFNHVILNCDNNISNIVIPYDNYIDCTFTASRGTAYSDSFHPTIINNNIKLKSYSIYDYRVLTDNNLNIYDKLNKIFPIYTINDIELGIMSAIDVIRACILEGQVDIADYLFNMCLNKFYYVEVNIKGIIYKLPIIKRFFDVNDSRLDNYNNYDDSNDDIWNHIFTNICGEIEVNNRNNIISPLIKYDEARISKYSTNVNENDTFNHFGSTMPISYVIRNLVYSSDYTNLGETRGSIELYKILDLTFSDNVGYNNNEININY